MTGAGDAVIMERISGMPRGDALVSLREIGARTEHGAVAGDDDRPGRRSCRRVTQPLGQFAEQL